MKFIAFKEVIFVIFHFHACYEVNNMSLFNYLKPTERDPLDGRALNSSDTCSSTSSQMCGKRIEPITRRRA